MEKQAAVNLIRDTIQNPFDRDRFIYFAKNLLNRIDESKAFHVRGYIPEIFKDHIKTYERIGTYTDPEDKKTDILVVYLQKEGALDRARTTQRNFVARYLKDRGEKDAGLIAFVSPDEEDWRFSFVKMEYRLAETPTGKIKAEEEFTPARRYSYLVGKNENSHTAQSRLLPLLRDDEHNPLLNEIEDAFSIEKVTREFFEKYCDLFMRTKKALDEIIKEDEKVKSDFQQKGVNTVDFSKKLLGQIVFLYFLQKKGWFGVARDAGWGTGPKNFLRLLFEKRLSNYQNFFNDILEPLFYNTLAVERTDDYSDRFNCKIPFLNGGLFDPINSYDWVHTDVLLPDELFSNDIKTKEGDIGTGILDVFDRYNFTVKEDEPLEKEVAVDPEMLGKVFENLLEVKDRKSKGTYYTPREIVHYMCQESLINYLDNVINTSKEVIAAQKAVQKKLIGENDPEQLGIMEQKQRTIIPKEDIESFIRHGISAVEHDRRVESEGRETRKYSYRMPDSIRLNARLFDNALQAVKICDPAVGSGAFLVGMMHEIIRARETLTTYLSDNEKRTPYNFKHHAIQNCLYGVDIDQGAVEIAKLRLWLSLMVDEEDIKHIKPLPNLDYKIVCGNSLLGINDLFHHAQLKKLEELKGRFFEETNSKKKSQLKDDIDHLINEITHNDKHFDFKVYFSEVFHPSNNSPFGKGGEGGFDIVIANPPYVKEDTNKNAFDGLRNTECYQGKMDLWYLFGCKGLDLLKHHGIMCFIATNNWISNDGAFKFRNKVVTKGRLIDFIDFGNYKVFTAGIQTMVYVMAKDSEPSQYELRYGKLLDDNADLALVSDFLGLKREISTPNFERYTVGFNRQDFVDTYIKFIPPIVNKVVEKIKKAGTFRLSDDEVFSGIDVMQDFVNKASVEKLGGKSEVGAGVFVISSKEKAGRSWNKRELEIIKPYYTTREINRYYANPQNQFWVLYAGAQINRSITDYPNIKKHLDQFKNIITSVNKPYGLHRTREERIFMGEKILSVRKCSQPSFAYVDFPCYVARTFLIIKSNRVNLKFLLGILNSKLIEFWLYEKGKLQGNLFQVDKVPLQSIPVKIVRQEEQNGVIKLVDKILAITKDSDYLENTAKQAKVRDYEKQIDQLVYKLYGLTPEEIVIIEGDKK